MMAVGLEVLPGTLLGTFGIGHIYAGRTGAGIGIMAAYWVLQAINLALMSIWVGFITFPLTWLAFLVLAPTDVLDSAAGP
ncbi:MAG: TM2 domain-containing membrane protein YozV [Kiritimatiellia bacterium]|jgi:TM2 domain-containing membrane protein YozV